MHSFVDIHTEIGTLERLLIHSPDNGLGKVVPSKAQDWLFEDIVHLDSIRKNEYDHYVKLLLYFLDPSVIKNRLKEVDDPNNNRVFYQPGHHLFHRSEKVLELQWLLAEVLVDDGLRAQMIAAVCALEGCTHATQMILSSYSPVALANCLISGTGEDRSLLFAPIPNFIFTRDIGIVVKDHIILNKPAKIARHRESLLAKYIFFHHPIFSAFRNNIIELHQNRPAFLMPENHTESMITLEGGDVMMVSPQHLIIGISERTTAAAAAQLTEVLFSKGLVEKVTLLHIPRKRDYMHIDTIFTQVKRNVWVMLGLFSEQANRKHNKPSIEKFLMREHEDHVSVMQFHRSSPHEPQMFSSLEALLRDISKNEFGCQHTTIIFSGNDEYPYAAREQWTDSCNLLALKEGVVLSYDRNEKTNAAFAAQGFRLVKVINLLEDLEAERMRVEDIHDMVILMPSAELSRARGGFHCMSMPLNRAALTAGTGLKALLMILPCSFGYNPETAKDNHFQQTGAEGQTQSKALQEFNQFVATLRAKDVNVWVIPDTPEPQTPDSIFPNNWISFHGQGRMVLYPMMAKNRRAERKHTVLEAVASKMEIREKTDFTHFEEVGKYLEGTGSMVLDRHHRIAYAARSKRTDPGLFQMFCDRMGYQPVLFDARDNQKKEIYHTNVLMCMADKFVVICLDAISGIENGITNREILVAKFEATGKEIIDISFDQMAHFCGNLLQVENKHGEKLLVMSTQAYRHFTPDQISIMSAYNKLVHSPLDTIETLGGGSARCMLCEVY